MYALLYRSTATRALAEADYDAIRDAAQARNGLWGVTGVLLCGPWATDTSAAVSGWASPFPPGLSPSGFVQWIEGEEETIRDLYAHIRADTRHTDTVEVASGDVLVAHTAGERLFPGWDMHVVPIEALPETLDAFLAVADGLRRDAALAG